MISLGKQRKGISMNGQGTGTRRKAMAAFAAAMLTLSMAFVFSGCSQNDDRSTDEKFIEAVGNGLEARWAITDSKEASSASTDTLNQALEKEKEAVKDFYDADFENQDLKQCARNYIDALNSLNADDYGSSSGYERWMRGYNQRVAALYNIDKISPISVGKTNESNLTEILNDGKEASAAIDLMNKADFVKQDPEYPGQTYFDYKAVVENASDVTFSYFYYNINLVDSDGVTVDTTIASTNDWAAGSKHTFEFTTDKAFDSIEVSSCGWSL